MSLSKEELEAIIISFLHSYGNLNPIKQSFISTRLGYILEEEPLKKS